MSAKDPTVTTLDRFSDPDLWEIRDAVPIFDEHEERDQTGAIVRQFGLAELEEIASNCNRREIETADAVPLMLGHTRPGIAETEQPPIVGYARQFRVGKFGPEKRNCILATFYYFKDRAKEAIEQFPRRSVELWIKDKIIDPIALLKRTPKRDLGLLTHYRSENRLLYAMEEPDRSMPICDPDDVPHPYPDYGDGDHDTMDGVMRYMGRHPVFRYAHKCYQESLKYNATAGYPAGGNTFMPGMGKLMMSKETETKDQPKPDVSKEPAVPPEQKRAEQAQHDIELARYQREAEAFRQVAEAQQKRIEALERESRVARYERDLGHLISQGYQMELAEEIKEVESYTAEQFERHIERIKKRYQRAPVGKDLLTLAGKGGEGGKPEDKELTQEQARQAVSMATREGSEFFGKYAEAVKFVRAQ